MPFGCSFAKVQKKSEKVMGNKENITCQVLQRYNVTCDVMAFARLAASPSVSFCRGANLTLALYECGFCIFFWRKKESL